MRHRSPTDDVDSSRHHDDESAGGTARRAFAKSCPDRTRLGAGNAPAPRIYTFKRGVFAGALSALGLVSLGSAIALSAKDGDVYLPADGDAYPTDLLNNFGRTSRTLFGISALALVGGAASFAPWERWTTSGLPACPEKPEGRWTFPQKVWPFVRSAAWPSRD